MSVESKLQIERAYFRKLYRQRLVDWFRYQDKKQHPAREDHSEYLSILSILEDYVEKDFYNGVYGWDDVRKSINSLSLEQLEFIHKRVERFKAERLTYRKL